MKKQKEWRSLVRLKERLLDTWKDKLAGISLNQTMEKIAQETLSWASMCFALETFFKDVEAYSELLKKHEKEDL